MLDSLPQNVPIRHSCPKCGNEVTLEVAELGLSDDYINNGVGANVMCHCGERMLTDKEIEDAAAERAQVEHFRKAGSEL
jgi:hypothetical protein